LIGYSLLSDAILTFQLFLAIYVKRVFNFSDQLVSYVVIIGLIFTVFGGFLANKLAYKLKSKEKALRVSSLLYAICFGLCAFIPQMPAFVFIIIALSGASYGLVFSLSRTVYSEISPVDKQGEFFSIYTVFERAASVVGPLVWLLSFYLLESFGESLFFHGPLNYLAS
jgi:UMF1 family MFS transporter